MRMIRAPACVLPHQLQRRYLPEPFLILWLSSLIHDDIYWSVSVEQGRFFIDRWTIRPLLSIMGQPWIIFFSTSLSSAIWIFCSHDKYCFSETASCSLLYAINAAALRCTPIHRNGTAAKNILQWKYIGFNIKKNPLASFWVSEK